MLQRTGADYEVDLAITVTPLGAISRLEHALDRFGEERERYRQRLAEYQRRLVSYQSRQSGAFAFADELAEKRQKLREVEEALATSAREDAGAEKVAAYPGGLSEKSPQTGQPKLITEQDGAIVSGAMEDMDDDHLRGFDAVEDQVVAMNAPTDTMVLVAGDEGEALRTCDEILTFAAQLSDEG